MMTSQEKGRFAALIGCTAVAWAVSAALALVAIAVALVALNAGPAASMPATATVTVRADGEWQSSGLHVQRGQRVLLVAAGAWRHDSYADTLYGPGGTGIYFDTAVLPKAKVGALLARVGGGTPFAVGNSAIFEVAENGYLEFAMNDDAGTYFNNLGEAQVQILVENR
jgi:hypothetical protein